MTLVAEIVTRECSFDGCGREKKSLGLCSTHYRQHRRGKPLSPIREKRTRVKTTAEVVRFEGLPLVTDIEPDGALTIVTVYTLEWLDKHQRYAEEHFSSPVVHELSHEYENSYGEHRVMTIWNPA